MDAPRSVCCEEVVLVLGLQHSGKTMFINVAFDGSACGGYLPTVGFMETVTTHGTHPLLFVEYGGTVVNHWKVFFKHAHAYRRRVSKVLLFVAGSADEACVEETRSAYMCLLYYFKELKTVPLCVIQHNKSVESAPLLEWSTVKKKLQLQLLLEQQFCSGNIVVVRLVYGDPTALHKNVQRILDWIIEKGVPHE